MASIEEQIRQSDCFGLAFSPSVKECKLCEVSLKCETKCRGGAVDKPEKPAPVQQAEVDEVSNSDEAMEKSQKKEAKANSAEAKKSTAKPKKDKPEVQYADDMPDFKSMDLDECLSLLSERGGNPDDFKKYDNNLGIKKMRVTMALKKTYEVA